MCDKCNCCHVPDYGACDEFVEGANGRCVYCDHAELCHPGVGKYFNGPLKTYERDGGKMEKLSKEGLSDGLAELITDMRKLKPEDRSELARRYAVTITELEKVYAYFRVFVCDYVE